MYLNFDKLTLSQLLYVFMIFFLYIMNTFLIHWKNLLVFLSLLSFSVLVMQVSMERLYAAKFAAAFFPLSLFEVQLNSPLTLWQGVQNLAQHVFFPFFEKLKILIKLLVRASLQYCIIHNVYKKHFFTGSSNPAQVFSCEFCKLLRTPFLQSTHLR